MEGPNDAVDQLWDRLRLVIDSTLIALPDRELFDEVTPLLKILPERETIEPASRPVVDEWLETSVLGATGPWSDVAEMLARANPDLRWLRAYEHLENSAELARFRDHYSFAALASPIFRGEVAAPIKADDQLVGFSLQAPGVFYPGHHHEPPELYGIISGTIEWKIGEGEWVTKCPGDVIVHRSHELHAMRTINEPALTWAVWPRNTKADVWMPSLDPAGQSMEPETYANR